MLEKLWRRYREARRIRSAIDSLPEGVCFAAEDGRPILTNPCMNDLCSRLLGHTVTNAEETWEKLRRIADDSGELVLLALPDGATWQFTRKRLVRERETVILLEAADVTELAEHRRRLAEQNRQVAALQARQRELLSGIARDHTEQELLRAKMRIHDDFGERIMMTRRMREEHSWESGGRELITAWEHVIDDMEHARETHEKEEVSPERELRQVVERIGCRMEIRGEQPADRKALLLLYAAIREALVNAVRHAGAECLRVDLHREGGFLAAEISSDGAKPAGPVKERGGLTNLRRRLEQEGGSLAVRSEDGVVLVIRIPEEYSGT